MVRVSAIKTKVSGLSNPCRVALPAAPRCRRKKTRRIMKSMVLKDNGGLNTPTAQPYPYNNRRGRRLDSKLVTAEEGNANLIRSSVHMFHVPTSPITTRVAIAKLLEISKTKRVSECIWPRAIAHPRSQGYDRIHCIESCSLTPMQNALDS